MKKIKIWSSLARGVWLESIRRKDLWVVAILGFLILIASSALGFFGTKGLESTLKDLASFVLGGFSTIIAIVTTARLMPDEVKNRTLYPLLSRPISRMDLLIGKLLGAVLVSWLSFAVLAALTAIALAMFHIPFEAVMAQYVLFKLMGLVVVCSVTLLLSLIMTPAAATTMSFIVIFGSGFISQALGMAYSGGSTAMKPLFQVINGILPQVGLFDLGGRASNSNWGTVPMWVGGFLFAYMVVYTAATMTLGWTSFRKRAL